MPTIYPYTVTNSYKGGFFMRTYGRNVRRAWDGDDYRAPKRQRLDGTFKPHASASMSANNENVPSFYDLEDNLERAIRETSVAALSSSPSRKNSTIFSLTESHEEMEVPATITPPSSPPPSLQVTPPNIKARKPTFAFMEKKKQKEKEKMKRHAEAATTNVSRDPSEPLSEIVNSSSRDGSQPTGPPAKDPSHASKPTASSKNMTQTVLDFGQSLLPITCAQCRMSYTAAVPEDVQMHNMYHNRHSQGIELGKPFLKSAMKWCYEVPHIPGSVVVVDRKISLPGRRVVQQVLEVINKELGSVDITDADLWSQKVLDDDQSGDENARKVDRYKAFLHVIDGKCVGVCLAERIAKAFRVKAEVTSTDAETSTPRRDDAAATEDGAHSIPTPTSASPIQDASPPSNSSADLVLDTEPSPVTVGVSRIWVSQPHRRKGIAVNLLDCVMNQFIYGMGIEREDVAFSQPTEMGVSLARGWFGEQAGWAVYHET